jgi:hypothetical protein
MRVDVFGRDGRLQRILIGTGAPREGSLYLRDVDVRVSGDTVDVAVALTLPDPEVRLYRWVGDKPVDSLAAGNDVP